MESIFTLLYYNTKMMCLDFLNNEQKKGAMIIVKK